MRSLLAATTPPTGRVVLVNGIEAWVEVSGDIYPISSQCYAPNVVHPDGDRRIESFEPEPWPRWVFRLESGHRVEQEIFVPHERAAVADSLAIARSTGKRDARRRECRCGSRFGRSFPAATTIRCITKIGLFASPPRRAGQRVTWRPYDGVPGIRASCRTAPTGDAPLWYRNFLYEQEAERGLDTTEDLASPGEFRWNLTAGDAVWLATAAGLPDALAEHGADALTTYQSLRLRETGRRAKFRHAARSCRRRLHRPTRHWPHDCRRLSLVH